MAMYAANGVSGIQTTLMGTENLNCKENPADTVVGNSYNQNDQTKVQKSCTTDRVLSIVFGLFQFQSIMYCRTALDDDEHGWLLAGVQRHRNVMSPYLFTKNLYYHFRH
jgi:hypothetical protein